jgi:hypothetical protein
MRCLRDAYSIIVREPEGKMPLGRPRLNWGNNIKIVL